MTERHLRRCGAPASQRRVHRTFKLSLHLSLLVLLGFPGCISYASGMRCRAVPSVLPQLAVFEWSTLLITAQAACLALAMGVH